MSLCGKDEIKLACGQSLLVIMGLQESKRDKVEQNTVMPVLKGLVNYQSVNVLCDTGCSGIVVKQKLVEPNQFTDHIQTCKLINGDIIKVSIVKITIDTPYLTKSVEAMCMKNSIYDLVVGNAEDARPPNDPNFNWEAKVNQQVGTIVTRGQKVKQEQIAKPLNVVNLETLNTPINTEKQ